MQAKAESPLRQHRVPEIELMKAVAIIAMVLVHVFEMSEELVLVSRSRQTAAFLIEFFGCIPSAAVFMFAMGWGAAYSKRAGAAVCVRRAGILALLGLVVNLFEEYLPAVLVPETYGPLSEMLPAILSTDIYFFAALTCLYLALMKKLVNRKTPALLLSVLIVAASFAVNILAGFESFTTGSEWLDTLLGLLIRVNEYSYFPFISWCVYPVLGYWLAPCFRKAGWRKAMVFAVVSGIAALLLSEWLIRLNGMEDATIVNVVEIREEYYYSLHPFYAMTGYGIVALEFALAHLAVLACRGRLPRFLLSMSRNVMPIYIVQWLLIGLLSPVLAGMTNIWINILLGIAVLLVSCAGGRLLEKAGFGTM